MGATEIDTANNFIGKADAFTKRLSDIRLAESEMNWYPYGSMSNVQHLSSILPEATRSLLGGGNVGWRILDIGAADGDLGYFFESLGCKVDFLDNPPINFNNCEGIKVLADKLSSPARLVIQDIDRSFTLDAQYDFAIALGLLYHLLDPMGFLMTLAQHAERMVLSTRVATHLVDGTPIGNSAVAYLLRSREANKDPTNYWILSPLGLETLLQRSGWQI